MSMVTCVCGCTIFETIRTYQYEISDFVVGTGSTTIPAEVNVIPVARCIKCTRILVPSTSLPGMSHLDPKVKAYTELVNASEAYNKRVSTIATVVNDTPLVLKALKNEIASLEVPQCACPGKGEEDVKATARSGKKSKTTVS